MKARGNDGNLHKLTDLLTEELHSAIDSMTDHGLQDSPLWNAVSAELKRRGEEL